MAKKNETVVEFAEGADESELNGRPPEGEIEDNGEESGEWETLVGGELGDEPRQRRRTADDDLDDDPDNAGGEGDEGDEPANKRTDKKEDEQPADFGQKAYQDLLSILKEDDPTYYENVKQRIRESRKPERAREVADKTPLPSFNDDGDERADRVPPKIAEIMEKTVMEMTGAEFQALQDYNRRKLESSLKNSRQEEDEIDSFARENASVRKGLGAYAAQLGLDATQQQAAVEEINSSMPALVKAIQRGEPGSIRSWGIAVAKELRLLKQTKATGRTSPEARREADRTRNALIAGGPAKGAAASKGSQTRNERDLEAMQTVRPRSSLILLDSYREGQGGGGKRR